MHWHTPVDIYCERVTVEFWAKPLNAASNIGFILAAILAMLTLKSAGRSAASIELALIVLAGLIGVGSFLFHTFANRRPKRAAQLGPLALTLYGT